MRIHALRLVVPALFALACGVGAQELSSAAPTDRVVRHIVDPHSGARWVLMRDASHPGGPGRLVLFPGHEIGAARSGGAAVIRAGDRLIVEEHSAAVDAAFEAVAMETAAEGARFRARLKLGGRVLSVTAVAPGRAALHAEAEGVR